MRDYGAISISPVLRYRNAHAAIAWLEDVLGFERHMVVPGESPDEVAHAELRLGEVFVGLSSLRKDGLYSMPPSLEGPYMALREIDALYERVKSRGADIAMEIHDTDYGSRDFAVRDPEGRIWSFGTYAPSLEEAQS
jgi:uncharacterized glyoxalase superfamily protein PhnB